MHAISRAGGVPRVCRWCRSLLITLVRFSSWNSRSISENTVSCPHTRGPAACVTVGRNACRPTDFAAELDITEVQADAKAFFTDCRIRERMHRTDITRAWENRHEAPSESARSQGSRGDKWIGEWRRLNVNISREIQLYSLTLYARVREKSLHQP